MNRLLAAPFLLVLAVILSGCLPLDDAAILKLVDGLAKDHASACVQIGAGGGAGGLAVASGGAIPMGGWANASLVACRSNEPGSEIIVNDTGITINHGIYRIPVDLKELNELRDKVKKFEEMPTILFMPSDAQGAESEAPSAEGGEL